MSRAKTNNDERVTQHHRRPKCCHGKRTPENILLVSKKKHQAWHTLVGDGGDISEVIRILNEFIDPEWAIIAYRKK